MKYRVERKYLCSDYQMLVLRQSLSAILPVDEYQTGDVYSVRSLYLDSYVDESYEENEDGVDDRKKYRIRIYPNTDERIRFEVKHKKKSRTRKEAFSIQREECEKILWGESLMEALGSGATGTGRRTDGEDGLRSRVAADGQAGLWKPAVIVDYERSAYVYPLGNVRITFDRNIAASTNILHFFERDLPLTPVLQTHMHLLEIKYDEFLPDFIAQLLDLGSLRHVTFSKYYLCRQALEMQKRLG